MHPPLGLVLTSSDLPHLRRAVSALPAASLRVRPAWCSLEPGAVVGLAEHLIVCPSHGDPSTGRPYPHPEHVLAEIAPWLAARPTAWVELGNEPQDVDPWQFRHYLLCAVDAVRRAHPGARLIAPALCPERDALRLADWLAVAADAYRRCDAAAIHCYAPQHATGMVSLLRQQVGAIPLWVTECNVPGALSPAARAAAIRDVLDGVQAHGACLYHLDDHAGPALAAQGDASYRLDLATLATLATPEPPTATHHPDRLDRFALDVWHWRDAAALRRHLARYAYRDTAPWARGVTAHHTVRPLPAEWRGRASVLSIARYYRDTRGWGAGPHLFIAGDGCPEATRGIWQMTPLSVPGVHAASFNASRWGVEIVGDHDAAPPSPATLRLAAGAVAALLDWAALPTTAVNGHRDDPATTKTCPGQRLTLAALRRAVDGERVR